MNNIVYHDFNNCQAPGSLPSCVADSAYSLNDLSVTYSACYTNIDASKRCKNCDSGLTFKSSSGLVPNTQFRAGLFTSTFISMHSRLYFYDLSTTNNYNSKIVAFIINNPSCVACTNSEFSYYFYFNIYRSASGVFFQVCMAITNNLQAIQQTICDTSNAVQIGTSTSIFYSWIDLSLIYSFSAHYLYKQIITYTPSFTSVSNSPFTVSSSYDYPSTSYSSFNYVIPYSINEPFVIIVMNKFIVQDTYTYINSILTSSILYPLEYIPLTLCTAACQTATPSGCQAPDPISTVCASTCVIPLNAVCSKCDSTNKYCLTQCSSTIPSFMVQTPNNDGRYFCLCKSNSLLDQTLNNCVLQTSGCDIRCNGQCLVVNNPQQCVGSCNPSAVNLNSYTNSDGTLSCICLSGTVQSAFDSTKCVYKSGCNLLCNGEECYTTGPNGDCSNGCKSMDGVILSGKKCVCTDNYKFNSETSKCEYTGNSNFAQVGWIVGFTIGGVIILAVIIIVIVYCIRKGKTSHITPERVKTSYITQQQTSFSIDQKASRKLFY